MSDELENIILTIDTREQNQQRIKAVEDWAVSHGAMVEHSALKHCDYRLIGEFRGVSVNLGIEAKSMSDFATSYSELPDKLARAYQLYDDVGLFVESANYTFTPDTDNFHATIDNPAVRNGKADVLSYHVYKNMLDSFAREGVHVRELRSAAAFPYDIAGILISITKKVHTGLEIDSGISDSQMRNAIGTAKYDELAKKRYIADYLNSLSKLPGIGAKRAEKLMKHYPNWFWLCSASSESLEQVMGKKEGRVLDHFIHCHDLITDEWKNNYHRDGTEKDEPLNICTKCHYTTPNSICPVCGTICDKPKLKKQDDEGRLAFDAPAKNPESTAIIDELEQVQKYGDGAQTLVKSCTCAFADPKKHAECKTPDHFKHSRIPSHAEGTILSNHNHLLPSADTIPSHPSACGNIPVHKDAHVVEGDTSSHPGTTLVHLPPQKPGDIPQPPITTDKSAVKQEGLGVISSPAETHDIGLDDKPLECVVKCRACHQVIIPEQDDNTGFCQDSDCIKIRGEPSLENKLRIYLREPHTVQEIVEKYGCSPGYTYQVCMANVNSGNIKKMTEQNGRVTFQRINI